MTEKEFFNLKPGDIFYAEDRGDYTLIHDTPRRMEDLLIGITCSKTDGIMIDEFVMDSEGAPERVEHFKKVTIGHGDAYEIIKEIDRHIKKIMSAIKICRRKKND